MVLALIEESVVPVASKNTKNGDMPEARTTFALRAREPLVPVQEAVAGVVVAGALTATDADCVVLPPSPVQFNM